MADNFESKKNTKASAYTLLVCVLLLLLFFYVSWSQPAEIPPVVEDGIEVNLGNSDQGLGTNQPYLPGDPSPQDKEKYEPPKQAVVEKEPVKDVETDDNNKEEAPVIKKAVVTKPNATKLPDKEVVKVKAKPVKQPEITPAPVKPHPKAMMGKVNGNGTGGNDADDYKPGGNQGVAGGHGDQGAPGGNPKSNNYTGGGRGNNGIKIMRGNREVEKAINLKGDFQEGAVLYADIRVDENGNGTFVRATKGQMEQQYIDYVTEKMRTRQITFKPKKGDESVINVQFKFNPPN
jgi:hypothetical protein